MAESPLTPLLGCCWREQCRGTMSIPHLPTPAVTRPLEGQDEWGQTPCLHQPLLHYHEWSGPAAPSPKSALSPGHFSNLILENISLRGDRRRVWEVLLITGFVCATHPAGTRWVFALEMPKILGRLLQVMELWVTWSWPSPSTQHPKHPRCS